MVKWTTPLSGQNQNTTDSKQTQNIQEIKKTDLYYDSITLIPFDTLNNYVAAREHKPVSYCACPKLG